MKIVVTDAYTANPGDINWAPLEKLGELEVWDRTAPSKRRDRCRDADIVLSNKVIMDRETISRLPKLKYIGIMATGYNTVDLEYASERGIVVTNVPDYCSSAVAQMVFAHMMELARRTGLHDESVRRGDWSRCPDFCYWKSQQIDFSGMTMGLVGFGNIGRRVAKIALAMEMKVIAFVPSRKQMDGVDFSTIEDVFKKSDVLSLHCPLTEKTRNIVNTHSLSKMKKNAFLINTGRGPLVNEKDLSEALRNGVIAGAGLDVMDSEPPDQDSPLFDAPNCFITPHIAWATVDSRKKLIDVAADNIQAFLNGNPVNVVNR